MSGRAIPRALDLLEKYILWYSTKQERIDDMLILSEARQSRANASAALSGVLAMMLHIVDGPWTDEEKLDGLRSILEQKGENDAVGP